MEELRFALLILGGCAIVAILAHGLWSLRKNNKPSEKARVEPVSHKPDPEGFDEFGIGEVRVVNQQSSSSEAEKHDVVDTDPSLDETSDFHVEKDNVEPILAREDEMLAENEELGLDKEPGHEVEPEPTPEPTPEPAKLYGSVVSNPKPTLTAAKSSKSTYSREPKLDSPEASESNKQIPEPPPFLLQTDSVVTEAPAQVDAPTEIKTESNIANDEVASFSLDQPVKQSESDDSLVSQTKRMVSRKRSRSIQRKRVEPSLGEDQMRIDFDTSQQAFDEPVEMPESPKAEERGAEKAPEQEVLVLNVRAPNEQEINGSALLPMLLTLGFKFGDQDIFHRHVNSNGKGPVLFSLANMFKPGVFDIDNLENFTTQGVSLFMILPIEGDPHQVFNMMHNAARKLAEEFSCQILDGRRSVLTKQGLQQYVEKIREFERQRIISRS